MNIPVFIIAGEVSGDYFAAELMAQLKEQKPISFIGCGGSKMRTQGLNPIAEDNSLFSAIGYIEALGFVHKHWKILTRIITAIKKHQCKHIILVDHEVFNILVAKKIRKHLGNSVKIYFYIPPRVSMWGSKVTPVVAKLCDAIFCYMQPDLEFYQKYNKNSFFFGNPLAKKLKTFIPNKNFFSEHHLDPNNHYIALMPGSRRQEIKELLPIFLQTALRLHLERNIHFLMSIAHDDLRHQIQKIIDKTHVQHCVHIINDSGLNVMHYCELGLVSAGTITLEAVMVGMYPIITYRLSNMTFNFIKKSERLGNETLIGLPNVFLKQRIFPEILQFEVTTERLYQESIYFLDMNPEIKKYLMTNAQERLGDTLGSIHSTGHVADYIIDELEQSYG
ncbi:MAG: lipid-A-disaccharide synthase [Brevinema sp.]